MELDGQNTNVTDAKRRAIVLAEASSGRPSEDFQKMARRRFQNPDPKREGKWWYLRLWQDVFVGHVSTRRRQRIKLAPASMPEREVKKIAAEMLRPMNQGLITIGSAVNFEEYVDKYLHTDRAAAAGKNHAGFLRRNYRQVSKAELRRFLSARSDSPYLAAVLFKQPEPRHCVPISSENTGRTVEHSALSGQVWISRQEPPGRLTTSAR